MKVGAQLKVTMQEILKLDNFQNVDVVAGHDGLNNDIENVYVMEVPDISAYVNEGGLLFTTLYPIVDNKTAMKNFIPELKKLGLAGVAIKVGRYVEEIPAYMLEQADDLSLPVLQLPSTSNFSFLLNDILTELLGKKTKELEFRESISSKLHTLLLSGADIKDLLSYVSVVTSMDIIIISEQLKFVEASSSDSSVNFKVMDDKFYVKSINKIEFLEDEPCIQFEGKVYLRKNVIIQPIDAGEKILGYIILIKKNDKSRLEYLDIIVEQSIILLAFLLQNRQTLLQKERNYLDNFIRDIINENYQFQSELIEKAKVFKWNFHFPNIILLIDITNNHEDNKVASYYKSIDSGIITEEIARSCEIPLENCKVALHNDHIICFISVALITDLSTKLKRASEQIAKHFKKYGSIKISISDKIYSIDEIQSSYNDAVLVQNIYKEVYKDESFIEFYNDIGIYKIFHLIKDKDYLSKYVEEKLGTVIASDEKNDMELIKTLKVLIKNNMNVKKSADELFIHYNSLRYRVNKLNELGIEIKDGNEMTEIAVACQLLSYLNNTT
ncbi:PucR family transcriptional regulator [Alkalibacterium sp. f15]|uniref:PucR family transcriptional regulator n=1 Tax=Alkalibacterium sp. f15 TaxID=3414029 RepID=UPI003BF7D052